MKVGEQSQVMSLQLLGSLNSLSPSAPGDSGLNQFLGDHTYHISQLQGKEPAHSGGQLLSFIHADVLQLHDQGPALPVCFLFVGRQLSVSSPSPQR